MKANFTLLISTGRLIDVIIVCLCLLGSSSAQAQQTLFQNTDTIFIPGEDAVPIPGKPYPSQITVANQKGLLSELTVTLYGYHHTNPDAVDILLVAPDGTNAVILSDVGGAVDIEGINITLDDAAATGLPDSKTFSSGTYQPTNFGFGPDSWPSPAPAASGTSTLSAFHGIDPNGVWSLYVISDADGAYGLFTGGWSLQLSTVKAKQDVKFKDVSGSYDPATKDVTVTWSTRFENGVDYFIIERSAGGSGWQKIGEIDSKGFSGNGHSYQFTDATAGSGNHLYRVKAVAKDGSVTSSNAISVKTGMQPGYIIYPNPAKTYTYVQSDSNNPEKIIVTLTDMNRNVIRQQQGEVSKSMPMRFDLNNVRPGTYFLVITNKNSQVAEVLTVTE